MMKHKSFRHIIVSTVMIVLLTSCAFYTLKKYDHEYDHETDETAIQRVGDWGFDLPNDTTVVNRYISKWQGWDGWFDSFYYVFKISDSYSLVNTKVIDNGYVILLFGGPIKAHRVLIEKAKNIKTNL